MRWPFDGNLNMAQPILNAHNKTEWDPAVIAFLWHRTGKVNTASVLIGAVGYLMLYASLITLSVRAGRTVPVILYALAICLFVFLCLVGILANLKDAKVHWVIEISNVICQLSVAVATVFLFL